MDHDKLPDRPVEFRKVAHSERFVRKPPRPLTLPNQVWINPPADGPEPRTLQLPRYTNSDEELSQTG